MAQTPPDNNNIIYPEDIEGYKKENYVGHFLGHYWHLILFGILFLGTLSLPMILSGVLPLEGLAIIAFFLVMFATALVIPQLTAVLLVLGAVAIMVAYPFFQFNTAGPALYIVIGYSFLAGSAFAIAKMAKTQKQQKETLTAVIENKDSGNVIEAPVAEEAVSATEETKEEAPKAKPVAFDKGIAATGISILFGTESGNSEELAKQAADALKGDGYAVQVLDNEVVDADHLKAFANLLMITSTWGDGDPPSNTVDMMEKIKSGGYSIDMSGTQFSVLALGDTGYEQFCKCGKDFEEYFTKFGSSKLHDRVDCDLDFEEPFQNWINGVKGALKANGLKSVAEYAEPEAVAA